VIEHNAKGGSYGATSPDVPDVLGVGATSEEAVERFRSGLATYLAFLKERGKDAPEPRHTVEMITV
jgi:predicted RNase H-like HicB family nuclease